MGSERFFSLFAIVFNFPSLGAHFLMYHSKNASESGSCFSPKVCGVIIVGHLTPHIILAIGSVRELSHAVGTYQIMSIVVSSSRVGVKVIKVHSGIGRYCFFQTVTKILPIAFFKIKKKKKKTLPIIFK
jgi:hypothetical protein